MDSKLIDIQAFLQDHLVRVQRHQRWIRVNPHLWAYLYYQLGIQFSHCISYQAWSTFIVLIILLQLNSSLCAFSIGIYLSCHIQVHLSGNNVPMVKPPPNHTSPPSMAATFLTTHLIVVLQPSRYSVFHGRDTPIQLSLPWRSCSCQCLNTEISARGNRGLPLKPWASPIISVCI